MAIAEKMSYALSFFGFAPQPQHEGDYYDDDIAAPTAPNQSGRKNNLKSVPLYDSIRGKNKRRPDVYSIRTIEPKGYEDSLIIADFFKQDIPVIMNLHKMDTSDARRLIDFSIGLTQGLDGTIKRITQKVYILAPYGVALTSDREDDEETPFNLGRKDVELIIDPSW
jgi:cell division inhibitor SepF